MQYDLKRLHAFCQELGFTSSMSSSTKLEITLSEQHVLVFWNDYTSDGSDNCVMGFKVTGCDGFNWHSHGDGIMFSDGIHFVEMNSLDMLKGIKDGTVLVCERWIEGKLDDRFLTHHQINALFEYMGKGEEIRVLRLNV